ncbi:hypothetical protein PO909_015540 [Leuciscus waleckii]
MGVVSRRKVISKYASNLGWGALYESRPVSGLWSSPEKRLHINCLEMRAVALSLKAFLPYLKGHHVLVRMDNMAVVSYINRQGSLRSNNLHAMARSLILRAQHNLCSLREAHVPGIQNHGADMLSRDNVPPGEWSLHPQTVQLIWSIFGEAEVDLFASEDNARCRTFFSKSKDVLAHDWPSRPLYAFPPVTMLPQPHGQYRRGEISSRRQTGNSGIPVPTCGPIMFGPSCLAPQREPGPPDSNIVLARIRVSQTGDRHETAEGE